MDERKNDFKTLAEKLISIVDFIKWTSTFGEGFIDQIEVPISGVRFKPALSNLFGVARDEAGWMLTMYEDEGPWLQNFPFGQAFVGFDDELLLVSGNFELMEVPFQQIGISIFIPREAIRDLLVKESTLGFGLVSERDGKAVVRRVNRIIPLYDPERYEAERTRCAISKRGNVFAAS